MATRLSLTQPDIFVFRQGAETVSPKRRRSGADLGIFTDFPCIRKGGGYKAPSFRKCETGAASRGGARKGCPAVEMRPDKKVQTCRFMS
ncbi:hypothetical protein, partial [Paracoccus sp. (in: a-proteobacteria)]|uniref:hypothetical protein n=1 Tax=Paracoccus sp. TaxID=267 RepID=UPI0035B4715C